MAMSLTEAVNNLLLGEPLKWAQFESFKAGKAHLEQPAQRRLFRYLLDLSSEKLGSLGDEQFKSLIAAWQNEAYDPAGEATAIDIRDPGGSWRLEKIEASNFGGLTLFGASTFVLLVNGANWCLEGQNGSGKSSLASSILWALTGMRNREQTGPIDERGVREPVHDSSGKEIGKWCPLIAYPDNATALVLTAEAWVRLTFNNEKGDEAVAYRKLTSPPTGEPVIEHNVDVRLRASPQLIETGILMPARLAKTGFGADSQNLYHAVKLLTGLDHLGLVGDAAAELAHGARAFLKWGKNQGLETLAEGFNRGLARAIQIATKLEIDLAEVSRIDTEQISVKLRKVAKGASDKAAENFGVLKAEIAATLDTNKTEDRVKVKSAVDAATAQANLELASVPVFSGWAALKNAAEPAQIATMQVAIETAKNKLAEALAWHERQQKDTRLRLKAIASQYITEPTSPAQVIDCPVCARPLTGETHKHVADELLQIKECASLAERKIGDACLAIGAELRQSLPGALKPISPSLPTMNPAIDYQAMIRSRFIDAPFAATLVGFTAMVKEIAAKQQGELPQFEFAPRPIETNDEIPNVKSLRDAMHDMQRAAALVEWWGNNQQAFVDAWIVLKGKPDGDGKLHRDSMLGRLEGLTQAIERAEPYDEMAKLLTDAAVVAERWKGINDHQKLRETIAKGLEPLKDLRQLVGSETAQSIAKLSGSIKGILGRIHSPERLAYEQTRLGKKEVNVAGSFEPGMQIDAGLVANTSWLRSILWAFILALRDENLAGRAYNPFPLMVFDDPQLTFDPRNMRSWSAETVKLANLHRLAPNSMQMFLTTHNHQFFQCIAEHDALVGRRGLIGRANKTTGVVTIVNGSHLEAAYDKAMTANDDALARDYIAEVRIYIESLLKFMMRAESPGIADMSLGDLREEMKRLHNMKVPPYTNKTFVDVFNYLGGSNPKVMKLINNLHHKKDETYGIAEAVLVRNEWDTIISPKLHDAFRVFANFEAHRGDPRTFISAPTVIQFPTSQADALRKVSMQETGIAAAAKADGLAGDGLVLMTDLPGDRITLNFHDVYQLAANTLDPVAELGDLVIVSHKAKVSPKNLVVAAFGARLLARRYNLPEDHPSAAVLTGQSVDPYNIPEPVIIPRAEVSLRKIVGTLFVSRILPPPKPDEDSEVCQVNDFPSVAKLIDGAKLFEVKGRSAEPIAIEGQLIITREAKIDAANLKRLDNCMVVAIDDSGARYFKRMRLHKKIVVLESLNPERHSNTEVLALDEAMDFAKLTGLLEVVGVLFERPT